MKDKLQQSTLDTFPANRTISFDVQKQLNDKYRTFTQFNEKSALQQMRKARRRKPLKEQPKDNDILKNMLNFAFALKSQNNKKQIIEELPGIKSERRERFKKASNPIQIINHYAQKEHFHPQNQEKYLIQQLIEIKTFAERQGNSLQLDKLLKRVYKLMNEAVDYNQMRFLGLLILLAADICYQVKDYRRGVYFYNEARVFATYADLLSIKMDALAALAHVAMDLALFDEAMLFLKKALQYAWKLKNVECELLLYDSMGSCMYHLGILKKATYFHRRFTHGDAEKADSAIKKISAEMLGQHQKYIHSLETRNLTSLFIEYINVPITNFDAVAPAVKHKPVYENYTDEGESPRKKKANKQFELSDFPDPKLQISRMLTEDKEFQTQIPNPDVQQIFQITENYGRPKKNQSFEQSPQYHRIVGITPPKLNFQRIYKYSIDRQVDRLKKDKPRLQWWHEMKDKLKKDQIQKVGQLKDRIRNSHQSYNKYPQERRRAQSLKNQKIKESFNTTLLDWIDPMK